MIISLPQKISTTYKELKYKKSIWREHLLKVEQPCSLEALLVFVKRSYFFLLKEPYIRYRPLQDILAKNPEEYQEILEVGSGSVGLAPLIKKKFVGVDLNPFGPHFPNIMRVQTDATKLPFRDNQFDLVVSLDMLEHVPSDSREKIIHEMIRVARKKVYLAFPSGDTAVAFEKKVRKVYDYCLARKDWNQKKKEQFRKRNYYIEEHEERGLPKEQAVHSYIKNYDQTYPGELKVDVIDNESIYIWYWWLLGDLRHNMLRWFFMLTTLFLFSPIISRVKWGGTYRKIFLIQKDKGS